MKFVWFIFLLLCIFANSCTPNRIVIRANYNEAISKHIDSSMEYIFEYAENNGTNPVRLMVYSNSASTDNPLLIVTQQQTRVTSWQLPYSANSPKNTQLYNNLAYTLCTNRTQSISRTFRKDAMSSNPVVTIKAPAKNSRYSFTIAANIQEDFFLKSGETYPTQVTVSQPVYYYYSFLDDGNDFEAVLVRATSRSSTCMIISIQNSTCPVFDLESNVKFESYWQTMTNKAGIVVKKSLYPEGFHVVMVLKQDDAECGKNITDSFTIERQKFVSLTVIDTISKKEHWTIAIWTIGIFGGVFFICFAAGIAYLIQAFRKKQNEIDQPIKPNAHESRNWWTLFRASSQSRNNTHNLWLVGIIALFYTFPVWQLVYINKGIVHETGNEDLCYYNFLCAHPLGFIYDFNHVFSNIGYVIFGFLFLIITYFKELMERGTQSDVYGLAKPFGLFYALGFALIMEGMMSACYHICPNSSNFQIETNFMYIMMILMIVNVYENRHSTGDKWGNAIFGILAVVTTLSAASLFIGEKLYFWVIFGVVQISFCGFLTWTLESALIRKLARSEKRPPITGVLVCRLIFWITGNLINWLLVGYSIYTRSGFETYLLMVLTVNGMFYIIYYIFMKICHKEQILLLTGIFFVLSMVVWGFALDFFFANVTAWDKSAAESRNLNEPCALVNYYDSHDIWHFLSSVALFCTFIMLLTLDDGLEKVPRADILPFHGNTHKGSEIDRQRKPKSK